MVNWINQIEGYLFRYLQIFNLIYLITILISPIILFPQLVLENKAFFFILLLIVFILILLINFKKHNILRYLTLIFLARNTIIFFELFIFVIQGYTNLIVSLIIIIILCYNIFSIYVLFIDEETTSQFS